MTRRDDSARVMITGATTPLGTALTRALAGDSRVARVLAVGVEPPTDELVAPKVAYARTDLTRERSLRELLFGRARELAIDAVVHIAQHRAARDVGRRVRLLNVESTRRLVHLAERHPSIERVLFASSAHVYRIDNLQPDVISEDQPLELRAGAPQWVCDRVEADLTVCMAMGMSRLHLFVLRFAEIFAPDSGSQLYDYLQSPLCLRPLGFDPMLNVLSLDDAVRALVAALYSDTQGTFNIPGADTLPLSLLIERAGRHTLAMPGPLLAPLYWLRGVLRRRDFRYDLNAPRFHYNAILDGRRARELLGYEPRTPLSFSRARAGRDRSARHEVRHTCASSDGAQ